MNTLSEAFRRGGRYSQALEAGEKALTVIKATANIGDTLAAESHSNVGVAYYYLRDYKKAQRYLDTALTLRLKAFGPNHPAVAKTYRNIGNIYADQGDWEKALEEYNKALTISLKTRGPDHPDVADSYCNIGLVYWSQGDYDRALKNLNRDLAISLKALGPEHPDVAVSYNNIGLIYADLGNFEKALENHKKALAIRIKILEPEHPGVAKTYNNIGIVFRHLGNYKEALESYNKSLAISLKKLGPNHPDAASNYNNLGNICYDLGEYDQALEYNNKALSIQLKAFGPDHQKVANTYCNLGLVYSALGDNVKALENQEKALAIWVRALGEENPNVARSYENIGLVYRCLGNYAQALDYHQQACTIWQKALGQKHPNLAHNYCNTGTVYYCLNDYQKAEDYQRKALAIVLKAFGKEHPFTAEVYYQLAKTLRAEKRLKPALDYLKKSIFITEKVRTGVSLEELKKSYTESVRDRYDEIVTLLLEMGRPKEAFEYFERSKSKFLQDELQKKGIEIGTGELKKKIGTVQSLSKQIGALEMQVVDEKSRPAGERNKGKIENLTRLLAQTKGEFYQLATEIKQNPDYAFTVAVDPIQFASIQKDLPEGNKLVMYYSSQDKLYILVVSSEGYSAKSVLVSKDSLASLVKVFRAVIDSTQLPPDQYSAGRNSQLINAETALYNYLILPIEHEVAAATEITFIPSGNLYYIPLGALAYEKDKRLHYLIEDKSISYLTSAELLRYVERKAKKPIGRYDFLLVGNPTGADLPSTENEVKAIHALYPKSGLYLGGDAKEPTIKKEASVYQILHLATHAFPNPQNPWDSYVYLVKAGEDDGRWTMAEVTNETWDKMALVTLSACETAIGGDKPGLEMESLARAFSIAGSPSIIASLWPVNDRSTQELMVNFYKNLKTMSKVEALRQAQLALLHNPDYAHPFFWAPFILIGDWR